jgi:two-component system response regulator RegA
MPGESGLSLIQRLKLLDDNTRIVVLTGYASIATAVEAIKLGAIHYLTKPADADEIVQAFWQDNGNVNVSIDEQRPTVNRLEWEYIQQVLNDCSGNISATARSLGMHRRTLQRKLQKRPVKR